MDVKNSSGSRRVDATLRPCGTTPASGRRTGDDGNFHARSVIRRPIHAVRRRPKVLGRSLEDVGHERLRVAVDDGEPGALDLDHDPMAALKSVVLSVKAEGVFENGVGRNRLRPFE